MKMNEVKSVTWTKLAKIKTKAKTPRGIYKALCKDFGVNFCEDVFAVADVFAVEDAIRDGNIQVCDDGIIVWGSWKEV